MTFRSDNSLEEPALAYSRPRSGGGRLAGSVIRGRDSTLYTYKALATGRQWRRWVADTASGRGSCNWRSGSRAFLTTARAEALEAQKLLSHIINGGTNCLASRLLSSIDQGALLAHTYLWSGSLFCVQASAPHRLHNHRPSLILGDRWCWKFDRRPMVYTTIELVQSMTFPIIYIYLVSCLNSCSSADTRNCPDTI